MPYDTGFCLAWLSSTRCIFQKKRLELGDGSTVGAQRRSPPGTKIQHDFSAPSARLRQSAVKGFFFGTLLCWDESITRRDAVDGRWHVLSEAGLGYKAIGAGQQRRLLMAVLII